MKYPGTIPDPQLEDWFSNAASKAGYVAANGTVNPCVRLYGPGPADQRCKQCAHLFRHLRHYFKCELRGFTRGPGTDHRANWPTCGKFEVRKA